MRHLTTNLSRASVVLAFLLLSVACSSSETSTTPTAAPSTTPETTANAPSTTATPTSTTQPPSTDPSSTETPFDPEQIATEALLGYTSLVGSSNPDYDTAEIGDRTMGDLRAATQAHFAQQLSIGATATGTFEVLDLAVTSASPSRIEVSICGLDGTEVSNAAGEVLTPGSTTAALYAAVIELDGEVWKPSGMGYANNELTECATASP